MIRVMIVDDHPVVRAGIGALLAEYPDVNVVGEADGGPDTLARCAELQPDILLLDIKLQAADGISLCRSLRSSLPDVRVIMLTNYDDESYLVNSLCAGAHGYLLKSSSPEILVDTLRAVQAGERRVSSSLITAALSSVERLGNESLMAELGLSEEELHLLQLLATGATNKVIAARLYMSDRTVKRKLQALMDKLGAATRAQVVAEGYRRGIL
ncbi:MAG TPA: response regulator transcription factor [Anaerolineaceae bacterium]|nr:response regulator transcription factor [Anaerolineaceae bacterium]